MAVVTIRDLPPPPDGCNGWPWTDSRDPRLVTGNQTSEAADDRYGTRLKSEEWPKISVITPNYNYAHFLEATIRSVLLQGYPNLEYIIIDDGSTDNSLEVIRKYERWLTYWEQQKNHGQTHAIDKGLARATGDVVAYLNSDDIYERGALISAGRHFADTGTDHLLYGNALYVDGCGRVIKRLSPPAFSFRQLLLGNFISQPAVFIGRDVVDRIGLFDETLQYAMDYEYWIRAALHGFRFDRVDDVYAVMRMHDESKTVAREHEFQDEIATFLEEAFASPMMPEAERSVRRQSIGRRHWLAALFLWNGGRVEAGRKRAVVALGEYRLAAEEEGAGFAAGTLIEDRYGAFLPPRTIEARLRAIPKNEPACAAFAQQATERFLGKIVEHIKTLSRRRALCFLIRLLMANPARIKSWRLRKVLMDRLSSVKGVSSTAGRGSV